MNNGNFRNAWITRYLLLLSLPFCTPGLPVQDLLDHFREDEGTRGRSSQRWECSNGCLPPRHIVSAQYGCSDKAVLCTTVNESTLNLFSLGLPHFAAKLVSQSQLGGILFIRNPTKASERASPSAVCGRLDIWWLPGQASTDPETRGD